MFMFFLAMVHPMGPPPGEREIFSTASHHRQRPQGGYPGQHAHSGYPGSAMTLLCQYRHLRAHQFTEYFQAEEINILVVYSPD